MSRKSGETGQIRYLDSQMQQTEQEKYLYSTGAATKVIKEEMSVVCNADCEREETYSYFSSGTAAGSPAICRPLSPGSWPVPGTRRCGAGGGVLLTTVSSC